MSVFLSKIFTNHSGFNLETSIIGRLYEIRSLQAHCQSVVQFLFTINEIQYANRSPLSGFRTVYGAFELKGSGFGSHVSNIQGS